MPFLFIYFSKNFIIVSTAKFTEQPLFNRSLIKRTLKFQKGDNSFCWLPQSDLFKIPGK